MSAVTKLTECKTSHSDTHKDLPVSFPASYSLDLLYNLDIHCVKYLDRASPLCFDPIIKYTDKR